MLRQSYGELSVEQIIQRIMWKSTHGGACMSIFKRMGMSIFQKNRISPASIGG